MAGVGLAARTLTDAAWVNWACGLWPGMRAVPMGYPGSLTAHGNTRKGEPCRDLERATA